MSYILVTSGRLRTGADELEGMNVRLSGKVEDLKTKETALKGLWEGEANEAFHAAFLRDAAQMETFHGAIVQYVQALRIIAAKYEEAEARNMQIASNRTCS